MKGFFSKIKSISIRELLREYAWLSRYSAQYKAEILWYMFMGMLGTVLSLAGSLLSKYIIDAVTDTVSGSDSSGLVAALVFFVLMQLSQILIHALSSRINAKISIRVDQQIKAQVYDRLLATDWEALSSYHSGDLLARMTGDVSAVSASVLGWFPDLCTRLLQFIGTFAVILYYDSTLALLALLSAPVTLLMSRYVFRMIRHHNKRMRQLGSEMMSFNQESFQNLQLIKAFDQAAVYSQKHRSLQAQYKQVTLEHNRFSIRKNTILSLVGTAVTLVCFCWSVYRLQSGHITFGTMTLFLQLAAGLSSAFSALAAMIPSAINAATAAGRIMAITQLPDEDRSDDSLVRDFIQRHGVQGLSVLAEGLTYHYAGHAPILSDAAFSAQAGQIVAFVGPSGEGKTTLLRLLLGIVQPKSGTLQLCAQDGATIRISPSTRSFFSYVPQENTLFSGTIAENLRLLRPAATRDELLSALKTACADEFVLQLPLGLDTPVAERGSSFSEGQLQRLCIARALLSDAPVLLMDEATSALDMDTEKQVLQNIMNDRKQRTCIITTHRPSVLQISDRIYRIHHDRIETVK